MNLNILFFIFLVQLGILAANEQHHKRLLLKKNENKSEKSISSKFKNQVGKFTTENHHQIPLQNIQLMSKNYVESNRSTFSPDKKQIMHPEILKTDIKAPQKNLNIESKKDTKIAQNNLHADSDAAPVKNVHKPEVGHKNDKLAHFAARRNFFIEKASKFLKDAKTSLFGTPNKANKNEEPSIMGVESPGLKKIKKKEEHFDNLDLQRSGITGKSDNTKTSEISSEKISTKNELTQQPETISNIKQNTHKKTIDQISEKFGQKIIDHREIKIPDTTKSSHGFQPNTAKLTDGKEKSVSSSKVQAGKPVKKSMDFSTKTSPQNELVIKDREKLSQLEMINNKKYSTFDKAAVAADHYKCSEIGTDILKMGGNSIDAAIAAHLCVEVINSHSTGLGGGGFLVYYDKNKGESFTVDFREQLPAKFHPQQNMTQGNTILVPGVLKGLHEAHKKAGKLPWKTLFQPAIKLAREGFRIHEILSVAIDKKKEYVMTNLGLRELFAPNGYLLKEGNLLKRPNLAKTYEIIAESGGSDVFYKGVIAQQIVTDVNEAGGNVTLDDLKNYKAIVREPLKTEVNGMDFLSVKAPASGATVALMLKIMQKFKWTTDLLKQNPGLLYHQMIEAMKFAYAPSTFLGDPNFVNHTDQIVDYMLSDQVVDSMFRKINNYSHVVDYYGPYSKLDMSKKTGTSHISVLGPEGDACSLTSSINAYFGSKILSRRLGFIYNNEISDFSDFWPNMYNYTQDAKVAGKRPMSKVAPLIMVHPETKNVQLVAGAAGGFFIPSCVGSTLAHHLFLNDNITTAINRPRIHCQLFPPTIVFEPTFPKSIVGLLRKFHHQFITEDTYTVSGQNHAIMGVVQAIARNKEDKLEANCDYRKGGVPNGF